MTTTFDYSAQRPSKGPKVLFTLGGIAVGLGVVMVVIGAALLGTGLFDTFKDLANARDDLETEVPVPGTGEVYLKADTYDVVAIGQDLVRQLPRDEDDTTTSRTTRANFHEPTVTVTNREGTPLTLREPRVNAMVSVTHYDMVSIKSFKVTTPGTYVIETTGEPGRVTAVGVGQAGSLDDATVGKLLGGGVLFGLGFLLIVPGVIALIAGGIWRSSDRKDRQPPSSGGWQPPSGPPSSYPPSGPSGIPPFNAPGPPSSPPAPPPTPPPPWEPPKSPIS